MEAHERARMKRKCIGSVVINGSEIIDIPSSKNPGVAKSFDIKRKQAIFYADNSGKYGVSRGKSKMNFPNYFESGSGIDYGKPNFI